MNNTIGAGAATMTFDTAGQNAYWYSDISYPTGSDDATIAAGSYTLNAYFSALPSAAAWWDGSYGLRQQIAVSAGSSSIPNDYPVRLQFDHATLVTDTKSLSSGDDLRVVHWNGSTWTELDRALFNDGITSSSWDSATTTLMFKTVSTISASGEDNGYYLYYDNSGAVSPPTNTPSSRYYIAEDLTETQTSSTTYANKVTLQFTPSATTEQYVVIATWRQRHVGGLGSIADAGESRIALNGTARTGTSEISYKMSGNVWKTAQAILKITGVVAQQTVAIEFSANGGTDAIDNARIVVFMIPDPSNADIQYVEDLPITTDSVNPADALTVTFTPTSAGDYIWMVNGFVHEGPGTGSQGGLLAEDETGADQQHSDESYTAQGDPFVPLVHFEQRNLAASSQTFTIRHQPDTTPGGERQGLTQLLFRSDVFDLVEFASATADTSTTSSSYQSKNSLTTASVGSDRDYVYLAVMGMYNGVNDITLSTFGEFRLDAVQQLEEEVAIGRTQNDRQIGWSDAERGTGNRIIDSRYRAESGQTTHALYAQILSLRYKEPGTGLGSEETSAGLTITVSVHHTKVDGTDAQLITSASTTIDSGTADPLVLDLGSAAEQTFTSADPRLLRVQVTVDEIDQATSFTLAYDSVVDPSSLDTPVVTVPEWGLAFLLLVPLIPFLMSAIWRRRRLAGNIATVFLGAIVAVALLANQVTPTTAAPDVFYLHTDAATGFSPVGEYMDIIEGTGGFSFPTQASATVDTTTASATDVAVSSMSITPGAGDYLVWFSGSVENSSTGFQYVSLYLDGSQIAHTEREIRTEGSIPATSFPVASHVRLTGVTAGQTIDVRWRTTAGTATMHQRTLVVEPMTPADTFEASSATDTTTSSTSDVLATGMTLTPGAGDYLVWFSSSVEANTTGTNQYVSIYQNGSQVAHTEREIYTEGSINNTSFPIATHAHIISLGASQSIEIRWRTTGISTATMHERTLVLQKIDSADISTATASGDTTTTSATDVLATPLSITPGAGDYLVWFSGSLENTSAGTTFDPFVSLYVNGTQVSPPERELTPQESRTHAQPPLACPPDVTGGATSDDIEVRWRTENGTATMHERTLVVQAQPPSGKKTFNSVGNTYWYADTAWPTGNDDASIASGNYTFNMYFNSLPPALSWYDSNWNYRKQITVQNS